MSDSEYEEEELLVFADFKNQLFSTQLSDENSAIKIIGVENKHPIAEINGNIFKGKQGVFAFALRTYSLLM